MRLKPSGLQCVDISGNFNAVFLCYSVRCLYQYFCAVLRFSYVILYGVYIPVFLSGFAMFVPS